MKYLPDDLRWALNNDLKQCPQLEMEDCFINVKDVLEAHYILADYFTDCSVEQEIEKMLVGVRSYDLLASALGRQCVEFAGKKKYIDKIDICATLFFGLVKDHAFHDGNKRTALLVLIFQLKKYGFFPKQKIKYFERLVLAVADNKLESMYTDIWYKFDGCEDQIIKVLSHIIKKLVVRQNKSFKINMDLTMKAFLELLKNAGVNFSIEGDKVRLFRTVRGYESERKLTYIINYHGRTRPVEKKMVRDTVKNLKLFDIYPSFESMSDGESSLYKMIKDFEMPLRRLKDK